MDNLEVDRLIKELHIIGAQLKRIADVMEPAPLVEASPFLEPSVPFPPASMQRTIDFDVEDDD